MCLKACDGQHLGKEGFKLGKKAKKVMRGRIGRSS